MIKWEFMKVNGKKILDGVEVSNGIKLEILMKANTSRIKLMAKEFINGLREKFTMESGFKERKLAMVYGEGCMEIAI
jgi:hypothetical protein